MAWVGVGSAAQLLGVTPRRVRALIAEGTLAASKTDGRWLVETRLVDQLADRRTGRPLSRRSAWGLVVASIEDAQDESTRQELSPEWWTWWTELDGAERGRARRRWRTLVAASLTHPAETPSQLRFLLAARATRLVFTLVPVDLPDLRVDRRVAPAGLSLPASGMSSGGIAEGYVDEGELGGLRRDFLLRSGVVDLGGAGGGNVILHVVPDELPAPVPVSTRLVLATDLAEWRSPREEGRAVDVLQNRPTGTDPA